MSVLLLILWIFLEQDTEYLNKQQIKLNSWKYSLPCLVGWMIRLLPPHLTRACNSGSSAAFQEPVDFEQQMYLLFLQYEVPKKKSMTLSFKFKYPMDYGLNSLTVKRLKFEGIFKLLLWLQIVTIYIYIYYIQLWKHGLVIKRVVSHLPYSTVLLKTL